MRTKPLDELTPEEDIAFNAELNKDISYFLRAIPNIEVGDTTDGQFMKMRTMPHDDNFSIGELIFELQWLLYIYNTDNKKKNPELGECKMIVSDLQITKKMRTEFFCPRRGVMAKIKYE